MNSTHVLAFATLALASSTACKKTQAVDTSASASGSAAVAMVAATAPDIPADTASAVTPPQALVAADPNIPLNEAVVGATQLPPDYSADMAPPAPVIEQQPPIPEPDETWVPGYWWWSRPLARYVWVSGAWRHPPPDQTWVAGSWSPSGGRYVWAPGYWGRRGEAREMIDVGPPPMQYEVRPSAPGPEFQWTPGYYAHREGRYVWSPGAWARPPSAGVSWVEPRYVSSGGRYYMQPGRWDFAPEHRGVVYHPDINARAGARVVLAPVPVAVVAVHERFAAESAHAVARGAERTANGGFVVPHAQANVVVQEHGRAPEQHVEEVRRNEEHGGVATVQEHERVNSEVHARPEETAHVEAHVGVREHEQAKPPEHEAQAQHERVQPHATAEMHPEHTAPVTHPTATTTAHPTEHTEHRR